MKRFFFNKALKILLVTNGIILFSSAMMGPIYALYVERIGGDLLAASITFAFYAFAAGLTALISGKYADKIKENELIIVLGYSLVAFAYFLFLFVSNIWMLFVVQIFIGFGEAIYSPAFDAQYSKHIDHHKAGTEWGAWETMNYFIFGIGAAIGGILVSLFGFTIIFVLMMILCSGSALYIYFLPRRAL